MVDFFTLHIEKHCLIFTRSGLARRSDLFTDKWERAFKELEKFNRPLLRFLVKELEPITSGLAIRCIRGVECGSIHMFL
jgi:hypothetical protein